MISNSIPIKVLASSPPPLQTIHHRRPQYHLVNLTLHPSCYPFVTNHPWQKQKNKYMLKLQSISHSVIISSGEQFDLQVHLRMYLEHWILLKCYQNVCKRKATRSLKRSRWKCDLKRPHRSSICLLQSSLWGLLKENRCLWRNRPQASMGCKNISTVGILASKWSWDRSVPVQKWFLCRLKVGGLIKVFILVSGRFLSPKVLIVSKGKIEIYIMNNTLWYFFKCLVLFTITSKNGLQLDWDSFYLLIRFMS